ncbi:hypothetical protein MNB_SUP05-SYMBIONT-5-575 [hydrothermal vent metagenome]|uniref:Uncharacterized protein n=1 Tax=hydrothermal vent metagenome TaxID=652676 RepID=A0A1W1E490_9ZZZZ
MQGFFVYAVLLYDDNTEHFNFVKNWVNSSVFGTVLFATCV